MEFGPVYRVKENLPRLVHLLKMVILGKVGICRAGFLDLLVAISDGNEGPGPIAVENKSPMGPVKDNGIHFGLGPVAEREGVQQRSKDDDRCRVRTIALHPVSQNFEPHQAFITTRIELSCF